MAKCKKYNGEEGSSVELPDYETREQTPEEKAQFGAAVAQYKVDKGMNPNINEDMTFKEAFAMARKSGDKTFEWHGKKYGTELAKPKAAPAKQAEAPKAKPSVAREDVAKSVRKPPEFMRKALGFKSGGSVSSASKRGDGCAIKGKTRGRMV